jgi:hypothetical protein
MKVLYVMNAIQVSRGLFFALLRAGAGAGVGVGKGIRVRVRVRVL